MIATVLAGHTKLTAVNGLIGPDFSPTQRTDLALSRQNGACRRHHDQTVPS